MIERAFSWKILRMSILGGVCIGVEGIIHYSLFNEDYSLIKEYYLTRGLFYDGDNSGFNLNFGV